MKLLRGELDEAEKLLKKAVDFARERNHQWYTVQAMRNLGRCYLAKGDIERAIEQARETIDFAGEIGNRHYANLAGLVLAESYLQQGDLEACENSLRVIEENDPNEDFFVLGNIQRIRGLAALEEKDEELAVHHFSRGLTIFEAAEDVYHTALMHYLTGAHLDARNATRARKHL